MSEKPTHLIEGDDGGGRRVFMPVNLPGNSKYTGRTSEAGGKEDPGTREKKRAEKVVTGEVIQRKRGFRKRIIDAFTGDKEPEDIWETIVTDILVAAFKRMISDAVTQGSDAVRDGFDRFLYGMTKPRSRTDQSRGYISYNKVRRSGQDYGTISQRARTRHDFNDIVLATRGEAQEVLDRLRELIDQFEVATVSDLYDLVGITGEFTDDRWGWYDLRSATVRNVRGGYLISLPRTRPIDS